MKQALVPCAAMLLAVPQAALAAEPLCEQLEAFAAAQWSEPDDPAPRHWVEFHRGVEGEAANRWSWGCRHSGDAASEAFCDWLMDQSSRNFQATLPANVLRCLEDERAEKAANAPVLLSGGIRRKAKDGSWLVLETASTGMGPGENAVRISFASDDRQLDPEVLPPIRAFAPEAKGPVATE